MTETREPRTIVAVVAEDGRFDHVRRRAIERARESGATLVLFDLDAGQSLLESPRPTNWSAQGEEEQFGNRLTIGDLEALGRGPIADQVRDARALGVDAFGWLPEKADRDALREYAAGQGARLVVVPAGERDLADDLGVPVEIVDASSEDRPARAHETGPVA
ncbi:MAG TPA: hypothetical protein VGQ58_06950 [Candidatus Limnocylindrales bacterium]|nr:hypothetical protein [Candidatus Limnocylindrales bacterium]